MAAEYNVLEDAMEFDITSSSNERVGDRMWHGAHLHLAALPDHLIVFLR